ncbi:hypothetical protein [Azospirillum sp. SYSU D00513]|uniref:hypothetical protein n=1 Tax=Azospirillum sp. SYSU D00513 TaxID=2812561 RepID=UPI001A96507A|nr:hypothetical protein [Azospirillum sp. SYSU D00513]
MVFGFHENRRDELALYTRSLVEILNTLAGGIQVPDGTVGSGQTYPTRVPDQSPGRLIGVRVQPKRPEDSFAAVEYGRNWYVIDKTDFATKSTFGLLMFLTAVMERSSLSPVPVISIPSG